MGEGERQGINGAKDSPTSDLWRQSLNIDVSQADVSNKGKGPGSTSMLNFPSASGIYMSAIPDISPDACGENRNPFDQDFNAHMEQSSKAPPEPNSGAEQDVQKPGGCEQANFDGKGTVQSNKQVDGVPVTFKHEDKPSIKNTSLQDFERQRAGKNDGATDEVSAPSNPVVDKPAEEHIATTAPSSDATTGAVQGRGVRVGAGFPPYVSQTSASFQGGPLYYGGAKYRNLRAAYPRPANTVGVKVTTPPMSTGPNGIPVYGPLAPRPTAHAMGGDMTSSRGYPPGMDLSGPAGYRGAWPVLPLPRAGAAPANEEAQETPTKRQYHTEEATGTSIKKRALSSPTVSSAEDGGTPNFKSGGNYTVEETRRRNRAAAMRCRQKKKSAGPGS